MTARMCANSTCAIAISPKTEEEKYRVEAIEAPPKPAKRSLLDRLGDVVGKAEGLPADASQNVDHYLYGHPKK